MSDAMMPIAANGLDYRNLLFNLDKPIVVSSETFHEVTSDEVWPYVDSVYAKLLHSERLQVYGTIRVQAYESRLGRVKSHRQLEKRLEAKLSTYLSNAGIVLFVIRRPVNSVQQL